MKFEISRADVADFTLGLLDGGDSVRETPMGLVLTAAFSSKTGTDWTPSLAPSTHERTTMTDEAHTIARAVPNIRSDRPAETRDFFTGLLGFDVVMDIGWVVTVASPTNPSVQVNIIGNDDPAAPGMSIEVGDVDAVHANAVERGLEIEYPIRDEEWGVRRFMLREPSGTTVNVVSHRAG